MRGFVKSAPGFGDLPLVINGCSDALIAIFGDRGRHARTRIGVAELPRGHSVEIDMVLGIR